MNTIQCPKCKHEFALDDAIGAELRGKLERDIKKQVEEQAAIEVQDLQKQLAEKDRKVAEFREQELKLRQEKRLLEEKEKDLKLEVQRQLDDQKKLIEEAVFEKAAEAHRLKDLEKDKKIADLEKLAKELERKSQQGSQQLQGEVQELDLRDNLAKQFPEDEIEDVGKGVHGADIRQIVKSKLGTVCGVILWESKQTKAWKDEWLSKLKDDVRAEKANIPIIVSTVLPREIKNGLGQKEGVYICSYPLALPLAELLHKNLIEVAYQKFVSQNRGNKADSIYEYVTSHEFRQQIEALAEVYREMQEQTGRERAAMERLWKAREGQIQRLLSATVNVYGKMQGLAGSTLGQIKGLELESGEE